MAIQHKKHDMVYFKDSEGIYRKGIYQYYVPMGFADILGAKNLIYTIPLSDVHKWDSKGSALVDAQKKKDKWLST